MTPNPSDRERSATRPVIYSGLLIALFLLSACGSARQAKIDKRPAYQVAFENSTIFSKSLSGFVLYDPSTKKIMYDQLGHKYFTPASNTKILTLYTALQILPDSIPALHFVENGDSLIFWGTGDPTFLHPYLAEEPTVFNFLKQTTKTLYFYNGHFTDTHYGPGWAWEDYNYAFQAEKSGLPIYGNVVTFRKAAQSSEIKAEPMHFQSSLKVDPKRSPYSIVRAPYANEYWHSPDPTEEALERERPFMVSDSLLVQLLSDTLARDVQIYPHALSDMTQKQTLYHHWQDSLFRLMMQDSDNFVSEQLLLLCSDVLFDSLETQRVIKHAQDSLFADLHHPPIWDDASGLSRYNLVTPHTLINILERLYHQLPAERWQAIFPAGGESGTIRNWYANEEAPYVYAKTGTLRNNHCLSGYLRTIRGRWLIFSFMHNHFPGQTDLYKQEMEKILRLIYLNY